MKRQRKGGAHRTASKKRKKRTSPFIIKFILILAALYGVLFHTPLLNIRNVYVEGNTASTNESIVAASGIYAGQNVLKINKKAAISNIEKIAYVSSAKIRYGFPVSVILSVNEGKIIANVKTADGYAAVDASLKVLDVCAEPKVYPVIEGLNVQKSITGEKITIDEQTNFDVILLYMDTLEKEGLLQDVYKIQYDDGAVTLFMHNSVVVECGGASEIDYKIASYKTAIEKQPVSIGTFDVTNPLKIVYSID